MPGGPVGLHPLARVARTVARHDRLRRVVLVAGGVLAAFLAWEWLTGVVAYTDDAFVRSDLVAVSPQVTGHVLAVHVQDNQAVHRGDLLVSIDPTPFRLAVDARQAAVREAEVQKAADRDAVSVAQDQLSSAAATLQFAQQTQHRVAALAADSDVSRQQSDAAEEGLRRSQAAIDAARAGLARRRQTLARDEAAAAQAQAELAIAVWRLSRTSMYAPVDGTVNNLTLQPGDTARENVPLIGIVDAHDWRIMANYKQSYVRAFRVGGTAWVWLDSDPWHFYRARIQGIARGISRTQQPDGLLPYVAPTTDWIRLQRRFPVTLVLTDPPPDGLLFMGADARAVIFP